MIGTPSNTVRKALHDSMGRHFMVVKMPGHGVGDACYTP